jgi:hypothetical protein
VASVEAAAFGGSLALKPVVDIVVIKNSPKNGEK